MEEPAGIDELRKWVEAHSPSSPDRVRTPSPSDWELTQFLLHHVINQQREQIMILNVKINALQDESNHWEGKYRTLQDLPICRMQVGNNGVPGNTEEALRMWYDYAKELSRETLELRQAVMRLT